MLAEAISAHLFQTMSRKAVREEEERALEHTGVPLTFSGGTSCSFTDPHSKKKHKSMRMNSQGRAGHAPFLSQWPRAAA